MTLLCRLFGHKWEWLYCDVGCDRVEVCRRCAKESGRTRPAPELERALVGLGR